MVKKLGLLLLQYLGQEELRGIHTEWNRRRKAEGRRRGRKERMEKRGGRRGWGKERMEKGGGRRRRRRGKML